jgi:hypothetical protein
MAMQLGSILSSRLQKYGVHKQVEAATVVEACSEIIKQCFPKATATRMCVASIRNNILTVDVETSVVGQELLFSEQRILELLQQKYPKIRIDRIRPRVV